MCFCMRTSMGLCCRIQDEELLLCKNSELRKINLRPLLSVCSEIVTRSHADVSARTDYGKSLSVERATTQNWRMRLLQARYRS